MANATPLTEGSPAVKSATTPAVSKEHAIKQLTESAGGDGSIFQQLASNPFFTAVCHFLLLSHHIQTRFPLIYNADEVVQGFGLAGLGAALRLGQQGLRRGTSLLRQRMLVDLEITRHDESYPWVLNWMTRQYQTQLSSSSSSP